MDASGPESPRLRVLRPPDAPYPGTLHAGDVPTVRVAADVFGATPAWRCDGAEHVLTALDATRDDAGVWAVLPHCPARLRDIVDDAPALTSGAAVTIAVSILRGAREADAVDATCGQWWVSAEGRPLVALVGEDDWREEARTLLAGLGAAATPELGEPLASALDALADRRATAESAARAEEALFAVTAGDSIPVDPPRRAEPGRRAATAREPRTTLPPAGGAILDGIGRLLDGDMADRLRSVGETLAVAVRRGPRSGRADAAPRRRRGPWLLAAGLTGVVVVAGVAWPSAAEPPAPAPTATARMHDETAADGQAAGGAPTAAADPATVPTVEDLRDPVVGAVAILAAVERCADDACVAEHWEAPERARRPASGPAAEVSLVDEYGGVAVVRAAASATTEIVVLVAGDGKWLVREIYDLADQP